MITAGTEAKQLHLAGCLVLSVFTSLALQNDDVIHSAARAADSVVDAAFHTDTAVLRRLLSRMIFELL